MCKALFVPQTGGGDVVELAVLQNGGAHRPRDDEGEDEPDDEDERDRGRPDRDHEEECDDHRRERAAASTTRPASMSNMPPR